MLKKVRIEDATSANSLVTEFMTLSVASTINLLGILRLGESGMVIGLMLFSMHILVMFAFSEFRSSDIRAAISTEIHAVMDSCIIVW